MGTFHIFVAGLSGEAVIMKDGQETEVKDWTKISEEEHKQQTMLRKTLDITYQIAGDEAQSELNDPRLISEEWVMR